MSRRPDLDADQEEGFLRRWSDRKRSGDRETRGQPGDDRADGEETLPLNTIVPEDSPGRMRTTVEADRLKSSREETEADAPVLTDADMPAPGVARRAQRLFRIPVPWRQRKVAQAGDAQAVYRGRFQRARRPG